MTLRTLSLTSALLAGLLLGSASAQNISSVTSSNDATVDATVSASVGSVLTISGTGFGTAKGKVFLTDSANKKYTLKVLPTDWTDTAITATILKAAAGDLTLNVLAKGTTVPATSPVTIEAPAILDLQDAAMQGSITSADPNTEFVITGNYFGTKKGKIRVGGKPAKLLSWADDMIHVLMPKTLANGLWNISLDNKVAIDGDNQITTTNSTVKIGKATLNLQLDGSGLSFKFTPAVPVAGHIVIVGVNGSNPVQQLTLIIPFDIDNDTAPATITSGATLTAVFLQTGKISGFQIPSVATYAANGSGLSSMTIQINAASAGQVAGTVDVLLEKQSDTFSPPHPDTLHLTGSFIVDA